MDADSVLKLKHEIGIHDIADPVPDPRIFHLRWVKTLALVVRSHSLRVIHRYPEKVIEWAAEIQVPGELDHMVAKLRAVRASIEEIDSDDGWATDKAGAALEQVTLALTPKSRWMAQAGQSVWGFATGVNGSFNAVIKCSRDAWLQRVYRDCVYGRKTEW